MVGRIVEMEMDKRKDEKTGGNVRFNQRKSLGAEGVRSLKGWWHVSAKNTRRCDPIEQGETADLAKVVPADELFEGLEVWSRMVCLEEFVPFRQGQDVVAKHAQLCVDYYMAGFLVPAAWAVAELGLVHSCDRKVDSDVYACAKNEAETG